MEGLSGFDQSMEKRLESSALVFYELKHQQRQQAELQCEVRPCADLDVTKTVGRHQRQPSFSCTQSTFPLPIADLLATETTSSSLRRAGEQDLQISDVGEEDGAAEAMLAKIAASTDSSRRPRPTSDHQGASPVASSSSTISFSISRILGHDGDTKVSRKTSALLYRSIAPVKSSSSASPGIVTSRAGSQSSVASPDSSCRVAGEDFDLDLKPMNDVSNDEEEDDVIKLQTESPAPSAVAIVNGDTLQRLSWLQCTRYKPPKLPRSKKMKEGAKKRKLGRNPRVPFTQHQVTLLEQKFRHTHYLSSIDVAELSTALNLTENRVKIWFQNRRARERRGKDVQSIVACMSTADSPLASGEDDQHQLSTSLGSQHPASAVVTDAADGCFSAISPFIYEDCGAGALTREDLLRQRFPSSVALCNSGRLVGPSISTLMRGATVDWRRSTWAVDIPRYSSAAAGSLGAVTVPSVTPVRLPVAAVAADLLAQLSSNLNVSQRLSSAFSPPSVNLLRF